MKLPSSILSQHIAFIGKTGSGKTSTAKKAIEQVVADGARVCILDTIKSDWWGITSSADGKKPGLPFQILGGPRGHVPLHPFSGAAIGELVAKGALPLSIVDTADLSGGQLNRFFVDFAAAVWKNMRGVLYLVIEEAHELAPKEMAGVKDENMAKHWSKKLATGARSKGLRLFVLTQRLQALHNALLGSCDTAIIHRLTLPADQKPALEWLKANMDKATVEEIAASLAGLPTGTGWICSGEAQIHERVAFPKISTYDNSATPKAGSGEHKVTTAPVDLEKLRSILGDAVKEAEANDPKLLRQEIAKLKAELAQQPKAKTDPAVIERAVAQAVAAEQASLKATARDLQFSFRRFADSFADLETTIKNTAADLCGETDSKIPRAPSIDPAGASRTLTDKTGTLVSSGTTGAIQGNRALPSQERQTLRSRKPKESSAFAKSSTLPKGEAAVLSALIQYPAGLRNEQLTVLTGYKRSSRDAYLQRLRERGYTERRGDLHIATDAGQAALPDAAPLPTGEALQQFWMNRLPEGERVILQVLIDAYPNAVGRDELSDATEYKRSSRDAYLQRLKAKQLIETSSEGVTASETLF